MGIENGHLNPSDEISVDTIKHRAVKGVVVLTGRTFILSLLSLAATALLTVFLSPSEFGIFWIVSAVVNFLAYFSDIGLAAALIQKKGELTKKDLSTTFGVQQLLIFTIVLILLLLTPLISGIYNLSAEGKMLLYSLLIGLVFSSLKTIPSVLMERGLEFNKLIVPQIVENVIYNLCAVYFAWRGFGIRSFTYAVFLRGLSGLVVTYLIKPWKPSISFSKSSFKSLLGFGIPYQANTLLATIKDDGLTAFLGGILGTTGIGYLGWAQKWGQAPLRFFMDHVIKVTFPAFSRLQARGKDLNQIATRSIFFICFLVYPSLFGLLALAPTLVDIIPKYEKWQPALIALFLIAGNTIFSSFTTQLTNLLNATGRIKTTFKLMVMWTVLTWLLVPYLSYQYYVNGAAFGYMLVGTSSIIAVYIIQKRIKISLLSSVLPPFISSLAMFVLIRLEITLLGGNFISVVISIITGGLFYLGLMFIFLRGKLTDDVKKAYRLFSTKE